MITLLARCYIKRKARKYKISLPDNYIEILKDYQKYTKYPITFIGDFIYSKNELGASSYSKYIVFSPEWGYQLLTNKDKNIVNAFLLTMKHEEAHKEKEFKPVNINDKHFSNIVTEIHCDFRGAELAFQSNRQTFIDSLNFKIQLIGLDKFCITHDEGCLSYHPSWNKRVYYAANYNFDEKLIRRVALDNNFTDENIILKASTHFDNIILK